MEQETKELSRNTIFILPRLFETEPWTIRMCLPGIVNGKAVWMEETFRGTLEEAKALVLKITELLPSVKANLEDINGEGF